ncbi:MAG: glycine--tRNA ligase subunit beta [Parvularculaceae bacterium]
MSELLLEILSEEIPARMQARAAADLEKLMNEKLLSAGFLPEGVKAFSTPRRLALVATGLPRRQPDRKEEKKGPRVGAPEKAVEGFLKSAGLSSLDQCEIRDDKKGAYYVAAIDEKGRETAEVLRAAVPEIVAAFPWPKSMRWGDGELRWVRPIHSVLCAFDGEIVPLVIDGIAASDQTRGHRFMANGEIRARSFESYAAALKSAKVLIDRDERIALIRGEAKTLTEAQGLTLVDDEGLLSEVAGLAEWPVVMIGSFDRKFLALPDEVLTAVMRGHQKYFSVKDPKTGRLANKFVFVANIEAPDGGKAMRPGYERVLTARLSDAWYLYNKDLQRPLEGRIADLDRVTFFEGLGSVGDKARRVAALAKEIAPKVGADPASAEQAALLAKADLTSAMVYEFPELQGIMGRYYYLAQQAQPALRDAGLRPAPQGEAGGKASNRTQPHPEEARSAVTKPHPEEARSAVTKDAAAIADAIRDHYKPKGADDDVPTAPVSVAVALADKIDTLTAFWAIGKRPTGSSDPFALRRAALAVIQSVLANGTRLILKNKFQESLGRLDQQFAYNRLEDANAAFAKAALTPGVAHVSITTESFGHGQKASFDIGRISGELLIFFHDRLKVYLRDKGHRHDHIDAVLTKADGSLEDDLVLIVMQLEALEAFLKTDDGANLAAAYKRAANILKAEEKKDVGRMKSASGASTDDGARGEGMADFIRPADESLLRLPEEKALHAALKAVEQHAEAAVREEKFADAMAALASLRRPVDSFFDKVTVNDPDPALRANRLALLARLRAATARVADLSKLEG